MRLADRFRRLDDRVLGPPPTGRRPVLFTPACLGWGAVGTAGSLLTNTTWGLVLFVTAGVVGLFTAGLIKSRRTLASAVVATDSEVTASKRDLVREWLARRNQRVRSLLVFTARFPFVVAPVIGVAVGFGISKDSSCATWRGSDKCAFHIPGHHSVLGGAGWGLLVGVLVYVGAGLIRQALVAAQTVPISAKTSRPVRKSASMSGPGRRRPWPRSSP